MGPRPEGSSIIMFRISISLSKGFTAEKVEALQVPCSVTSMTFFDRLEKEELVRKGGRIVKCFDEFYEEFTISDEVRKVCWDFCAK